MVVNTGTGLRWVSGVAVSSALLLCVPGCGNEQPEPGTNPMPTNQSASAPSRSDGAPIPQPTGSADTRAAIPSASAGWGKKLTRITADGYDTAGENKILIYFTLDNTPTRVCQQKVTESATEVRVLVELCAKTTKKVEPWIAGSNFVEIPLSSPLGQRTVLDAEGREILRLIRPTPGG